MKTKRILVLALTILMLTALAIPALAITAEEAAETGSKMYITTQSSDTVSMRSSPGAKYDSVFKVPYGSQVYVYESIVNGADEKWYRIHYYDQNGKCFNGYMNERYLTYDQPKDREDEKPSGKDNSSDNTVTVDTGMFKGFNKVGETCTVNPSKSGSYVNMRWAPSMSMPVITRYDDGAELYVLAENRTWCQVYDEETGVCGFMYKSMTSRGQ